MSSTFHILAPDYQADPFPHYARMREEGLSRMDPGGHVVVSRYTDVVAAFRNTAVFSSRAFSNAWEPAWLGSNPCANTMHSLDPPEHTKMRNLVNTAFLQSVIERTTPFIQSLADSAASRFEERSEVEVLTDVALPVTAGTIGHFLRLDPALHTKFKGWSDAFVSITPVPRSPEHAKFVRTSLDEAASFMRALIEERRQVMGDDLVGLLMKAEVDGQRLTDKEIVGFLALLLIGGLETTMSLIAKSVLLLTERTDILDEVRANLSLVPSFVDEMLRYEPPVHSLFRFVKQDTEIAGQKVPAGTTALLMIAAANRDERQFPNPDAFDLRRESRGGLAFGFGPHFCVGMSLAKLEARLALTALLKRFQRFELLEPTIRWNHTYIVRAPVTLRVRGVPA